MNTKRRVLLAICEAPGWQPPEQASSIDRSLHELQREGWILPRLDGYEATPQALDAYPAFTIQEDIADEAQQPAEEKAPVDHACVPIDRVAWLIAAMLTELPVVKVAAMTVATPHQLPPDAALWNMAATLAERMRP